MDMAADNMRISIVAKGPVRKYVDGKDAVMPRGSTTSMLVSKLRIPGELRVMCMRDGKRIPPSTKLHEGDSIMIISMLSGG